MKTTWRERGLNAAWDAWCIASGIGIWPRYIEPQLLKIRRIDLPIFNLPLKLEGLRILHLSDLHWSGHFSQLLQKKLIRKALSLKPDFIFFTGDFLCRSKLDDPVGLSCLLSSLQAKFGCFAVLGNHDYESFITVNDEGDYDVEDDSSRPDIRKGFDRLFHPVQLTGRISLRARETLYHEKLTELLKATPFQLLNNATVRVSCNGSRINICGLEEYMTGRFCPKDAFKGYDDRYPGVVLSHNPDALPQLLDWPGDLILSGHTHGGQVNLPFLWKRCTQIEHPQYKRGLHPLLCGQAESAICAGVPVKWAYINCGLSSVLKFRWFALPELTLLTLQRKKV